MAAIDGPMAAVDGPQVGQDQGQELGPVLVEGNHIWRAVSGPGLSITPDYVQCDRPSEFAIQRTLRTCSSKCEEADINVVHLAQLLCPHTVCVTVKVMVQRCLNNIH